MTTRRLLVVAITLAALPSLVLAGHRWNGYHWKRSSNPVTLTLGDNVDSRWDAYLIEAEKDWESSTVLTLSIVPGAASSAKRCNAATGKIEVCNAAYGRTGWLGVAGISVSGGHITSGYTKLNDTYFDTAQYNTPAWRRLVTCQEIGHDFGLGHQDENFSNQNLGSCMDYTNDPDGGGAYGPSNEHPNGHDFDQLQTDYGHADSIDLIDALAQETAPFNDPEVLAMLAAGQWGSPIRWDADGRPITFVLKSRAMHGGDDADPCGANCQITHVFWAPDDPFESERSEKPRQ